VHAGIVGADHDQPAVRPGDGRIHERVGGDVETDVLEGDHGPLAGERDAKGLLVGRFLVDRPDGRELPAAFGGPDQVFQDLRGWRPGIGVGGREPGVDGAQGDGFVAEKNLVFHVALLLFL
jgi:hypothetical protein